LTNFRRELDLLGEREVPVDAYYGIHTVRAFENFAITGVRIGHYPDLIVALAAIKEAAATTNMSLGLLDQRLGDTIVLPVRRFVLGSCMINLL